MKDTNLTKFLLDGGVFLAPGEFSDAEVAVSVL